MGEASGYRGEVRGEVVMQNGQSTRGAMAGPYGGASGRRVWHACAGKPSS